MNELGSQDLGPNVDCVVLKEGRCGEHEDNIPL